MTHSDLWEIDVSRDDVVIVRIVEPRLLEGLDAASDEWWQSVHSAADGPSDVAFDFTRCKYLSTVFINELLRLNKKLRDSKRRLVLFGLSRVVREVFRTGRGFAFPIAETEQDALASLQELADGLCSDN